jgi:hypothetical protein
MLMMADVYCVVLLMASIVVLHAAVHSDNQYYCAACCVLCTVIDVLHAGCSTVCSIVSLML